MLMCISFRLHGWIETKLIILVCVLYALYMQRPVEMCATHVYRYDYSCPTFLHNFIMLAFHLVNLFVLQSI